MMPAMVAWVLAVGALASNPASAAAPAAPTLCECAARKRCWSLVLNAFGQISGAAKTEVEGSAPGQFFPEARANALRRAGKDGHFLRVTCGPQRALCTGYRDALEKRLAVSSLLRSLPLHPPEKELFDSKTWEITPLGDKILDEALRCRPQLWSELAPILLASPAFF